MAKKRGKGPNGETLKEMTLSVMRSYRQAIPIQKIIFLLKRAGYKSTSCNFDVMVFHVLKNNPELFGKGFYYGEPGYYAKNNAKSK